MAKKDKAKKTRLIALLVVLIGVVVAYFALQGGTGDLQGRFNKRVTRTSIKTTTTVKPSVTVKKDIDLISSATKKNPLYLGVVINDDNSTIPATLYKITSAEANSLLKGTKLTISSPSFVLLDKNNNALALMNGKGQAQNLQPGNLLTSVTTSTVGVHIDPTGNTEFDFSSFINYGFDLGDTPDGPIPGDTPPVGPDPDAPGPRGPKDPKPEPAPAPATFNYGELFNKNDFTMVQPTQLKNFQF